MIFAHKGGMIMGHEIFSSYDYMSSMSSRGVSYSSDEERRSKERKHDVTKKLDSFRSHRR